MVQSMRRSFLLLATTAALGLAAGAPVFAQYKLCRTQNDQMHCTSVGGTSPTEVIKGKKILNTLTPTMGDEPGDTR